MSRSSVADDWNPGWRTKAIACAVGALIGVLALVSPHGYGWGGAIGAAGGALVVPMIAFRRFWSLDRFWITFGLLAALHVPIVILVRPLVEQYRFVFLLAFGATDCTFVIAVIYWACSSVRSNIT